MKKNSLILVAEDDAGHFELVRRNLWLSCVEHDIIHFKDGQEVLDFLLKKTKHPAHDENNSYFLLLDIRMPGVDGHEVLRQMKLHPELKKIPVIMLTTTADQAEINRCYEMGCSFYMVKPVDYSRFMKAVENLGLFLSMDAIRVPHIDSKL